MNIAFADECVRDNCWNLYDSYGQICVHCGCCSNDKKTRYNARIKVIEGWIWQQENWYKPDETWEDYQINNRREKLRNWKRQLRYYKRRVSE